MILWVSFNIYGLTECISLHNEIRRHHNGLDSTQYQPWEEIWCSVTAMLNSAID
jgi:hypothetical protein